MRKIWLVSCFPWGFLPDVLAMLEEMVFLRQRGVVPTSGGREQTPQ